MQGTCYITEENNKFKVFEDQIYKKINKYSLCNSFNYIMQKKIIFNCFSF